MSALSRWTTTAMCGFIGHGARLVLEKPGHAALPEAPALGVVAVEVSQIQVLDDDMVGYWWGRFRTQLLLPCVGGTTSTSRLGVLFMAQCLVQQWIHVTRQLLGAFGRFSLKENSNPEVDSRFSLVVAAHIVDNGSGMLCTGFVGLHVPPLCSSIVRMLGREVPPLLGWRSVLGRCFDCVDSPSLWHLEPGHHFQEPCVSGSQCSLFEFCFRRFSCVRHRWCAGVGGSLSRVTRHRGFSHRGTFFGLRLAASSPAQ